MATVLEPRVARGADAPAPEAEHRRLTLNHLVIGVLGLVGLSIGLRPISDNSFFTHLATGRRILTVGFPHSDPYTFTAHGTPWVVQSWLASVLYGVLDRVAGMRAIVVLVVMVTMALVWLLWRLSAPAQQLAGRLVVTLPALLLAGGQWGPRPYMFGLLALAALIALDQSSFDVRWALPITWLWMQMHGSFPFGPAALLLLALGQRLDGLPWRRSVSVAKWSVAGIALGVLNPFGPKLLVFPLALLQRNDMLHNIVEWQSPAFTSWAERAFLVQLVVVVALLARRPSWRLAIPTMVFVPMALVSSRNLVVASVILVAAAAPSAQGIGTMLGRQRVAAGRLMVAVLVLLAVVIGVSSTNRPAGDYAAYPNGALAWLSQQGQLNSRSRIVAPDVVGNYLELAYGGTVPVYVDDRAEVFSRDTFADELTLMRATNQWSAALDRAHPSAVLWPRSLALTSVLLESPSWRAVYADPSWVVFEPR